MNASVLLCQESCIPDFNHAGSGIKVSFAGRYKWLFLCFGLREEDQDDGQGEASLRIDFSNNYKFEGLWNVCG